MHLDEDSWLDLLQLQALVEKVIYFLNAKEGIELKTFSFANFFLLTMI